MKMIFSMEAETMLRWTNANFEEESNRGRLIHLGFGQPIQLELPFVSDEEECLWRLRWIGSYEERDHAFIQVGSPTYRDVTEQAYDTWCWRNDL